jgi:hypothetical protein
VLYTLLEASYNLRGILHPQDLIVLSVMALTRLSCPELAPERVRLPLPALKRQMLMIHVGCYNASTTACTTEGPTCAWSALAASSAAAVAAASASGASVC